MRNAKHIVAVMVVATAALCADRAVAAAPVQSRPAVADLARQLATKLSVNLRRVVPAIRMSYSTYVAFSTPCDVRFVDTTPPISHGLTLSPFQFRLPPPQRG